MNRLALVVLDALQKLQQQRDQVALEVGRVSAQPPIQRALQAVENAQY